MVMLVNIWGMDGSGVWEEYNGCFSGKGGNFCPPGADNIGAPANSSDGDGSDGCKGLVVRGRVVI